MYIRGYNLAIEKNKLIIYKYDLNEFLENAKGQSEKVSLIQYNIIRNALQKVTENKGSWVNITAP